MNQVQKEIDQKCELCDSDAAALFALPKGCVCSPKQIQLLCMQHVVRATPLGGMRLLEIIDDQWEDELIKRFGDPNVRK
jgi:hypothetical protein